MFRANSGNLRKFYKCRRETIERRLSAGIAGEFQSALEYPNIQKRISNIPRRFLLRRFAFVRLIEFRFGRILYGAGRNITVYSSSSRASFALYELSVFIDERGIRGCGRLYPVLADRRGFRGARVRFIAVRRSDCCTGRGGAKTLPVIAVVEIASDIHTPVIEARASCVYSFAVLTD